jgi:regulator of replication initiation timing
MKLERLRAWVSEEARELLDDIDAPSRWRMGTAPADSPLGIELSKIRDRLNKLETQVPPVHPSVRDRLGVLENCSLEQAFKTYSNFERRLNEHASQLTQLEGDVKHAVEEEGLLHRIEALMRRVHALEKCVERLEKERQT